LATSVIAFTTHSLLSLLLILDNCEHLAQACAELADYLVQRCWRLHILATRRME
jgi:predicted ATPase